MGPYRDKQHLPSIKGRTVKGGEELGTQESRASSLQMQEEREGPQMRTHCCYHLQPMLKLELLPFFWV